MAAATATGAKIGGPVPLPTKRRIYCVLRSPHVNKAGGSLRTSTGLTLILLFILRTFCAPGGC